MADYSFKDKWCILDTNILSAMAKEKRAEKFRSVFDFLIDNGNEPYCLNATAFEFLGFSGNKKEYEKLNSWIKKFNVVNVREDDNDQAIHISSLYKNRDPSLNSKQISYCDCLHAAQLVKREGKAFLVTTDIHDYPISLFDISKIMVIEEGPRALLVGFITFNSQKWTEAQRAF